MKDMKRLFIVGASELQLPAIEKAKKLGLYVAVADYNPHACGIPYADVFYNVSTIDEIGICKAAQEFKADGIITIATDMPMRSVAYTADQLGLAGITYDTAIRATDKGEMIKVFQKNDVAHPWYFLLQNINGLNDIVDKITFPCICKPVDNAGSRGVVLIETKEHLQSSIEYSFFHSRKNGVIIEEYLKGKEVSVEVLVIDGEIHILQITDKLTNGAPHFVEMGHSQPTQLDIGSINSVEKLARKAVKAIGINSGPAHVEIMLTEEGPKMIELGARMGGDCITTHLVPLSTGIDMVEATIKIALGESVEVTSRLSKGAAIRYFPEQRGRIKRITGIEDAAISRGVKEVRFNRNVGDFVNEVGSSVDRIGYVISQANSPQEAIACCENAISKIKIEVE